MSTKPNRPQYKDWNGIRDAWLRGMSYGDIAKKFNCAKSTVCARAKREEWHLLKEYTARETERKICQTISTEHAQREVEISEQVSIGVKGIVDKVNQGLRYASAKDYTKLRVYMSILKDAKDMGIYKTDRDIAEQTARIKKLEKDIALQEAPTVNVVLSKEVDAYGD